MLPIEERRSDVVVDILLGWEAGVAVNWPMRSKPSRRMQDHMQSKGEEKSMIEIEMNGERRGKNPVGWSERL